MPPPTAPCLASVVDTVGAKAICPPETVVPLETSMSVAVLNMVELVYVTLLLAILGPELKSTNVPL